MAFFLTLPTVSPVQYRGNYPTRIRSISAGATGLHVELNNGTRLWAAPGQCPAELPALREDFAAIAAAAPAMTAEQYAALQEAAELARSIVNIAGHERRKRTEALARAMAAAIPAMVPAAPEGLPPAYDESVSNDSQAATMAGREEAETLETLTAAAPAARTINIGPQSWAEALNAWRPVFETGSAEGRAMLWAELQRVAALADERNRMAESLAEIRGLLNGWPTMRALTAHGAEVATKRKQAVRDIVARHLPAETVSGGRS